MAIYVTTALGRDVPQHEWGTVVEDLVLKVLHDFRMSPFNPNNQPMTRTQLANASGLSPQEAEATAEALAEKGYVRKVQSHPEPSFSITGAGVTFVRNMPQGFASAR
jgi:predicted transcriptional regulator